MIIIHFFLIPFSLLNFEITTTQMLMTCNNLDILSQRFFNNKYSKIFILSEIKETSQQLLTIIHELTNVREHPTEILSIFFTECLVLENRIDSIWCFLYNELILLTMEIPLVIIKLCKLGNEIDQDDDELKKSLNNLMIIGEEINDVNNSNYSFFIERENKLSERNKYPNENIYSRNYTNLLMEMISYLEIKNLLEIIEPIKEDQLKDLNIILKNHLQKLEKDNIFEKICFKLLNICKKCEVKNHLVEIDDILNKSRTWKRKKRQIIYKCKNLMLVQIELRHSTRNYLQEALEINNLVNQIKIHKILIDNVIRSLMEMMDIDSEENIKIEIKELNKGIIDLKVYIDLYNIKNNNLKELFIINEICKNTIKNIFHEYETKVQNDSYQKAVTKIENANEKNIVFYIFIGGLIIVILLFQIISYFYKVIKNRT